MADMILCACGIAKEDCDYHKSQFIPITDGSVIYFRYDQNSKSWKLVPWNSVAETDHYEYTLTPA